MTAQVIPLRIKPQSQDDLAGMIRRIEAQNQRAEIERDCWLVIEFCERNLKIARGVLADLDGGPIDAA